MPSRAFARLCAWSNLLAAWHSAARGKRGTVAVAGFERQLADQLLQLQSELWQRRYRPGQYVHFYIHDPKRRKISAAPFRDRVVHHALCNIIEPRFEQRFMPESYANRVGRGTHKAVDRLQAYAKRYRYVLRIDIVKHFPSIDHVILRDILARAIPEPEIMGLIDVILASGRGVLDDEYVPVLFPGDGPEALVRPRGLPIGNLTSQFWSNCYLHPLDQCIKRELRCSAYVRYVDDAALFSDSKVELWAWKRAIIERLATLRLTLHEHAAQVLPVTCGIPWLGFVVYPTHRRLKARKVRSTTRHLHARLADYHAGRISFAEFDASVQGWANHVRYADSWGLRRHVFRHLVV
jgi:hypothetical protein